MDPVTTALLALFIACVVGLLLRSHFRHYGKRLPPGPRGLPIVGSALSIPARDYIFFEQQKRRYGDLVYLHIGSMPFLYLNTTRAMREALIGQADVFSGRIFSEYFDKLVGSSGIIFQDGLKWQEHRRFTLKVLRDFGAGKAVAEQKTLDEFDAYLDRLPIGQAVNVIPVFTSAINNVIAQLVLGERTGTEDPEFEEFQRRLDSINRDKSITVLLPVIMPFVTKIPPLMQILEYFSGFEKLIDYAHSYMREKISQHEDALKEVGGDVDQQEPKDLCDALLIERARKEKENQDEPHTFTDMQLIRDLLELFIAGTDTTATTLSWAVFLMAVHHDEQMKVQIEIDSVIGKSRKPSMKDRRDMPYVSATIDEILRVSTIAPSGLPHRCRQDTELMGYFVPKDTVVVTNLYAIHRDAEVWERPDDFYPGHFLTQDGKEYKPSDHLLSFSMGRRACLGENLARMELFLFFVSIFQHLSVQMADPTADVAAIMTGKGGGQRRLLPHEVIFISR